MAVDKTKSGDETPTASLEAMISRAAQAADSGPGVKRGLPPVEKWNPDFCGDIDMEIKADGTWFYMGTPIGRASLVRLFSTVLLKDDDGKTYLITPVEKIGIRVEDAHFVAVELDVDGEGDKQTLVFRTNVGDIVKAGPDNPLRFEIVEENDGLKPYLLVRGRLEAVLARPVMYQLIALGEELEMDGTVMFAVRSGDAVFPIMPAEELARRSE